MERDKTEASELSGATQTSKPLGSLGFLLESFLENSEIHANYHITNTQPLGRLGGLFFLLNLEK